MKAYFLLLFLVFSIPSFPQIGVGTINPHASSILELKSSDKGFLPPRLNLDTDVLNPAEGLIIYDNSDNCINVFIGGGWKNLCSDDDVECEKNFFTTDANTQIKKLPYFINLDTHRGANFSAITSDGELFSKGKFNTILNNSIVGADTLALVNGPWTSLNIKLIESCFLYEDQTTNSYTIGVISNKKVFVANTIDTTNTSLNQFREYDLDVALGSNEHFVDIKCSLRGVLVLTDLGNTYYLASKSDDSYDSSLLFEKLIGIPEAVTVIEDTKGIMNTHIAAYGGSSGSLYVIGETDGDYNYNSITPVSITTYPMSSFGNSNIKDIDGIARIVILTENGDFYRIIGNKNTQPILIPGLDIPAGETIEKFKVAHLSDINIMTTSNKLYYISTNPPVLMKNMVFSTPNLYDTFFERRKTPYILWILNGQICMKKAASPSDLPSFFIPILG